MNLLEGLLRLAGNVPRVVGGAGGDHTASAVDERANLHGPVSVRLEARVRTLNGRLRGSIGATRLGPVERPLPISAHGLFERGQANTSGVEQAVRGAVKAGRNAHPIPRSQDLAQAGGTLGVARNAKVGLGAGAFAGGARRALVRGRWSSKRPTTL